MLLPVFKLEKKLSHLFTCLLFECVLSPFGNTIGTPL